MTIYEKTPGGLITTGDRAVQTFQSGLVRVDRKYMAAQGTEATHRATLAVNESLPNDDGSPAIDGLYIFPDAQESKDGTGFVDFQVSGYGRTTSTGRITGQAQEKGIINDVTIGVITFDLKVSLGAIVVPTGTILTVEDVLLPNNFYTPSNFRLTQFPNFNQSEINLVNTIPAPLEIKVYKVTFTNTGEEAIIRYFWIQDPQILITAQRNFGYWTEIEYQTSRAVEFTSDSL